MICTERFTQQLDGLAITIEALVLYVQGFRFTLAINSYIEVAQ